tara:strand:+ start:185 stop:568 length:384 start_codon:yes stop_codon:yes gene_type:complete
MNPDAPIKQEIGLRRLWNATGCSIKGLKRIWQDEAAFRQEVGLCAALIPLMLLDLTSMERVCLIAVCFLVLIVEVLNSAIEAAIDRVGYEWHDFSEKAKDLGSLAVTLSLMLAALVWGVIILPALGL